MSAPAAARAPAKCPATPPATAPSNTDQPPRDRIGTNTNYLAFERSPTGGDGVGGPTTRPSSIVMEGQIS